jgi:hypothetical protein
VLVCYIVVALLLYLHCVAADNIDFLQPEAFEAVEKSRQEKLDPSLHGCLLFAGGRILPATPAAAAAAAEEEAVGVAAGLAAIAGEDPEDPEVSSEPELIVIEDHTARVCAQPHTVL